MKYSKYILWLAAPFLFASCGDDFLNRLPSENASEEQVQDAIERNPDAIKGYITG